MFDKTALVFMCIIRVPVHYNLRFRLYVEHTHHQSDLTREATVVTRAVIIQPICVIFECSSKQIIRRTNPG